MSAELVSCANCKGTGGSRAFVDYAPPRTNESGLHTIPCPECDGAGALPAGEHARRVERRAEGLRFRHARMVEGLSLYDASQTFGVSVVVVSQWECGRAALPEAARAWLAAAPRGNVAP